MVALLAIALRILGGYWRQDVLRLVALRMSSTPVWLYCWRSLTDTGRILAPRCDEVGGFKEVEHAGMVVLLAIVHEYWEDIGAEMC